MRDDGQVVEVEAVVSNYEYANSYENNKAHCYDNLSESTAASEG